MVRKIISKQNDQSDKVMKKSLVSLKIQRKDAPVTTGVKRRLLRIPQNQSSSSSSS